MNDITMYFKLVIKVVFKLIIMEISVNTRIKPTIDPMFKCWMLVVMQMTTMLLVIICKT